MNRLHVRLLRYSALCIVFAGTLAVTLTQAQERPPVYLFGVGVPSTPVARAGERTTVPLHVTVVNTSASPATVIVGAQLTGSAIESSSGAQTIPAGGRQRFELRLDADLTRLSLRPASGNVQGMLFLYIDRAAVHKFAFQLPVAASTRSSPLPSIVADVIGSDRDLSLDSVRVTSAQRKLEATARRDLISTQTVSIEAVLHNIGHQAWGYRGELVVDIYEGTPEAGLTLLGGMPSCNNCGVHVGTPSGLRVGEQKMQPVVLRTGHGLGQNGASIVPGRYYTATVRFESEFDQRADNNNRYLTFRVNSRFGIDEQRMSEMPASTNRIAVR